MQENKLVFNDMDSREKLEEKYQFTGSKNTTYCLSIESKPFEPEKGIMVGKWQDEAHYYGTWDAMLAIFNKVKADSPNIYSYEEDSDEKRFITKITDFKIAYLIQLESIEILESHNIDNFLKNQKAIFQGFFAFTHKKNI